MEMMAPGHLIEKSQFVLVRVSKFRLFFHKPRVQVCEPSMAVVDDLDNYRRPWNLTRERAEESDCT